MSGYSARKRKRCEPWRNAAPHGWIKAFEGYLAYRSARRHDPVVIAALGVGLPQIRKDLIALASYFTASMDRWCNHE